MLISVHFFIHNTVVVDCFLTFLGIFLSNFLEFIVFFTISIDFINRKYRFIKLFLTKNNKQNTLHYFGQ